MCCPKAHIKVGVEKGMELETPDLHISFKQNPLKKSAGCVQAEAPRCKQVLLLSGGNVP